MEILMFFSYSHSHAGGQDSGAGSWDEFGAGRRERHDRHHRPRGPHGGEGERVFEHGDLRLVIMALLADKPRYGYEIIKALEERVGGGYSPSPGVVYPTLTMLEEMGHASVTDEHGGRRLYTLTDEGRAFLAGNRRAADGIFARLDEVNASRRAPPASILRAMENLGRALRHRMRRPISHERAHIIAAALDAAARAVEEG
jgi:DNA-binding PadR family transcriptional regulator